MRGELDFQCREVHRKRHVTITSTPYDKDDTKWLSIAVSDTGIGMTEEQLSKILQEYAQADSSTAANYGGTGLGLTITTSLIQMMGGYLDVESEYGTGTTFTIKCSALH